MDKFINKQEFMTQLFDEKGTAERAGEIGDAILAARSLRLTDVSVEMEGESAAGYKRIQRFLKGEDPRSALWRLFQEGAEFVIGDTNRDRKAASLEDRVCGHAQRRKDEGVLGISPGHAVSRKSHSMWLRDLLIQNDCTEPGFAQPEPLPGI